MPARSASTANAMADRGVCSAGLRTTVQPAARAGASFRVIIALGKFHGVMAAQTPMGSRMTSIRLVATVDDMISPVTRLPCRSEAHTSELQSLMRISYAVFCLKKKKNKQLKEN